MSGAPAHPEGEKKEEKKEKKEDSHAPKERPALYKFLDNIGLYVKGRVIDVLGIGGSVIKAPVTVGKRSVEGVMEGVEIVTKYKSKEEGIGNKAAEAVERAFMAGGRVGAWPARKVGDVVEATGHTAGKVGGSPFRALQHIGSKTWNFITGLIPEWVKNGFANVTGHGAPHAPAQGNGRVHKKAEEGGGDPGHAAPAH